MPSFDAGHYHFTALIPLLQAESSPPERPPWRWRPGACTPLQSLRELLASLRSVDVPDLEGESAVQGRVARALPFSRDGRTHFARLVVVENLAYNGLQRGDTLVDLLRGLLPWAALRPADRGAADRGAADHLPGPFLLVLLDFDAPDGSPAGVERYLNRLWQGMEQEWTLILRHCRGFEADPQRCRQSFVALLLQHEIETTFTYNGYLAAAEQAGRWQLPTGTFRERPASDRWGALLPAAIWLALLLAALLAPPLLGLGQLLLRPGRPMLPGGWLWILPLPVLLLVLPLIWQRLLRRANAPWPPQPGTDLPSVLKALYLQGRFLELAEDWQNRSPSAAGSLRERFRAFLHESQPLDPEAPTLRPGLIGAVRRRPAA